MAEAQEEIMQEYGDIEISELLLYFSRNTYSAAANHDGEPRNYLEDVTKLMERDYSIVKIDNAKGSLCMQYPEVIPIMEEYGRNVSTIFENSPYKNPFKLNPVKLATYIDKAKIARCRQRFPVPVIFYNGRFICRSSTVASEPEVCYRTGLINVSGFELLKSVKELWWPIEGLGPNPEVDEGDLKGPGLYDNNSKAQTICDTVRSNDRFLLKYYNVATIIDIMVEKRKVKHSLYVSASEKVAPKQYKTYFKLISLPYPGCEFFKEYHDKMFNAEGLKYNWNQKSNDAVLTVPANRNYLNIPWNEYKKWDLVALTQNYLKYILKRLQDEKFGISLHCISGWDRTPLFISLIRLSLWADGLIHPSLNEYEILYFTIAYDWYLFGHHLSNRLYKNEEIMAFCFDFLRYITGDEFSCHTLKKRYSGEMKTDDSRSPSRSSNSSTSADDNLSHKSKKKKLFSDDVSATNDDFVDALMVEPGFERIASPTEIEPMDIANNSDVCTRSLTEAMDTVLQADQHSSGVLSPTKSCKGSSPIPVAGGRQRTESSSSTNSWQLINDCGSIEKEISLKSQRLQKLEKVRTIFNSCYQKTVKKESFGPPSSWMVDEFYGPISQLNEISSKLGLPFGLWSSNDNEENETKTKEPEKKGEKNGNGGEHHEDDDDAMEESYDFVNSNETQ
ncbi:hypothetical protein ABEB36_010908 [Hypothenemus hampei]|uniref:Myotubularin-related protein 14 n=1 Tax=Hypothenemus hampei TaxID=57062 RepID=A0ABD1EE56_HYPHA